MNNKASLTIVAALSGLLAIGSVSTAEAAMHSAHKKSGSKLGVLDCVVAPGIGLILGSSKSISCTFKGKGRVEHYRGTTGKLGLDLGITNKSYLTWVVFGPGKLQRGALAGHYVGASAQATLGAGLGANVLVGGGNGINLQPISIQGQTGLNIAAGLASLTLKPVR